MDLFFTGKFKEFCMSSIHCFNSDQQGKAVSFRRTSRHWRRQKHKNCGLLLMCSASQESPQSDIRWEGSCITEWIKPIPSSLNLFLILIWCSVWCLLAYFYWRNRQVSTRQSVRPNSAQIDSSPDNQLSPICLPHNIWLFCYLIPEKTISLHLHWPARASDLVDSTCWCYCQSLVIQELPLP